MFAMRPSGRTAEREAVEFEPARAYISQLRYDSVAFVSGYTSELDRLEDQVPAVLADIDEALKDASMSWQHVAKLSLYLSRSTKPRVAEGVVAKSKSIGSRKNRIRVC
jgi:enamine deaminase RidA (YjgF/YER057c/UK114 family)